MEDKERQTHAYEGVEPTSSGAGFEINQSDNQTTFWGVLCRTCHELIPFDVCPYASFGPGAANMKAGAIRCGRGHNHIYFPHDFQFLSFAVPINDALMQKNREIYRAINPSSNAPFGGLSKPNAYDESNVSPDTPQSAKARPASLLPDVRRQSAQIAAKDRWANWAIKKVG